MRNDPAQITDEQLGEALRGLPRERAAPGFETRVLARVEDGGWRAFGPRLRLAAAAAGIAGVVALGYGELREVEHEDAARARLAALRAEQRALESELAELRRLTAEARPVVYLESGDAGGVDVVLDLARIARRWPRDRRPASLTLDRDDNRAVPALDRGI